MIRATILGATGYSGGELIRYLLNHPTAKIVHATSESSAGQPVASIHHEFRNRTSLVLEKLDISKVARDTDVVFSCLPAAVGIKIAAHFLKAGAKVIDFSADFRLPSASLYESWYKEKHTAPDLLKSAVYGLPELFREKIRQAKLIANPGCYPTASLLAMAPLAFKRLADPKSYIVDAKSGVSGAGKKIASSYMYVEVDGNLQPYNVAKHRHQPEIETAIQRFSGQAAQVTFTPHLVPMPRGILSVVYASLKKSISTNSLRELYAEFYKGSPFVRILPENELPQTKNVAYTNYCDIGIAQDARSRRAIIMSAIDNLGKGASSQAVQNMNLCFNRPETEGLI